MFRDSNLRAEDFRNAWPTAYQLAISQVEDLHLSTHGLLDRAHEISEVLQSTSVKTCHHIERTAETILQRIDRMQNNSENAISAAVSELVLQRERLVAKEADFERRTKRIVELLAEQREEIKHQRNLFYQLPLWKRLQIAIYGEH